MSRFFNRLEDGLMAFFLALMTILTFVQVVLRYVFNSGLVWSLEATVFAFGWLVLIGASSGIRTNTHIVVDFVVESLSPKLRMAAALAAVSLCLLYAALMGWGGFAFVERLAALGNNARDIPVPKWMFMSILPVGFLLLGVRLVQATFEIVSGARTSLGAHETVESAETSDV